jgi:hypothetical protein
MAKMGIRWIREPKARRGDGETRRRGDTNDGDTKYQKDFNELWDETPRLPISPSPRRRVISGGHHGQQVRLGHDASYR